jgi:uncharacterized membrane protein YebE (DUF533 family)
MDQTFSREQLLAFARAMASVAAADGHVGPEERAGLEKIILGIGLSPDDAQVASLVEKELSRPTPIAELVGGIESRQMRGMLLRMMAEIACADGQVAVQERARVADAAVALGYAATLADELLDWVADSIRLERREAELMAKLLG